MGPWQDQSMISRERIHRALDHREPDVLPIDFGGMRSTGIQAIAYNRLVSHLGMDETARVYDIFQQLAEPSDAMVERMNGDVLQVHRYEPAFGIPIRNWKEDVLPDGSACVVPEGYKPRKNEREGWDILGPDGVVIATRPSGGLYFDQVIHPYAEAKTTADIGRVPLSSVSREEVEFVAAEARRKRESTDKALLFAFGGNILEAGQLDFGYETFFMNLALDPDLMHYYFARITENYLSALDTLMPVIAEDIDIIQFGDDLGTQVAPQISVDMYRTMIKPYHKKIYEYAKSKWPKTRVFLHSCGAIFDLIPDLIETGVEILNPVQISAAGMDPVKLKNEFGRDLVFWGGGSNMQQTVATGSISEIKDEVRRLIDVFAKDGGFVFTQVHNIQADVSPEKVLAIYDTAGEYR